MEEARRTKKTLKGHLTRIANKLTKLTATADDVIPSEEIVYH